MIGYERELLALQRASRFRTRHVVDPLMIDFASNDYLGLAHHHDLRHRAIESIDAYGSHGAKASLMVNGYHPLHHKLEDKLALLSKGSEVMIVGSGFLANIAIIESMIRSTDCLVMDSEFHASGILASRLVRGEVHVFSHNDPEDLDRVLKGLKAKRVMVAVEGIYSMSGDLLSQDVIDVVKFYEAYLLLDEAHSMGVIGENLGGILDYYHLDFQPWIVKMGTLGKALGSYGAYIMADPSVMRYIENRAKSVIYSTALSLFDTALAYEALCEIEKQKSSFITHIKERQKLFLHHFQMDKKGLIFPIKAPSSAVCLQWGEVLSKAKMSVGTIRPPTVEHPILRVIGRLEPTLEQFDDLICRIKAL